jgi:hypothetical protein
MFPVSVCLGIENETLREDVDLVHSLVTSSAAETSLDIKLSEFELYRERFLDFGFGFARNDKQ